MIIAQLLAMLMILQTGTTVAQESGLSPFLTEISDLPLSTINNFTFNGVFKNVEIVASFLDCLGSHFTWLQNIYTNFPALLNFVSKLKCVTGLCPKDLEDYGCTCRYEMEGLPIDEIDSCCFQHRKCYEEALEVDCTWDPAKITADVSCLSKNLTCETGDACEKVLCDCDKAAIECLVNSQINSSMKGMDITFCPALVTDTTAQKNEIAFDAKSQQNRSVDTSYTPSEGEQIGLQNDVTTFPSTEETPNLTETTTHVFSTPVIGPPDMSTESSAAGLSTAAIGDVSSKDIITAAETTTRKLNMTPTRAGFKMADESTVNSAAFPLTTVTESDLQESLERVCDRYHFNQMTEDGNVKTELPLLGEMLFCLTGRCPEEFESYGCHCGQEGRGSPIDILDSCCFSHHCCIEHLKKLGCKSERSVRSEVLCMDNKPTCIGWGICDKLLCACDKAAAECMAAAPFNESVHLLHMSQCRNEMVLCRSGDADDTPDRAIPEKSDSSSSSSEESSEEHSPMRDVVRAGHGPRPNSGSPLPRARRPRSTFVGN
ncbi:otoconin-90 isoform X1 [Pelobates fuscus]|uniref:otoconin-90 isoform X1 n=1 Tax=Pelobates fuscus TaxID=191477 RepID=UPI002FE4D891